MFFIQYFNIFIFLIYPSLIPNTSFSQFQTSIAFFTIIGCEKYILDGEDLRGRTWEYQLKNMPTIKSKVTFVSNGHVNIPGYESLVLTDSGNYSADKNLCERTINSMITFKQNFSQYKWYFRGTTDTFIVLDNLIDIIHDLESKYDPMKEIVMAYGMHEWRFMMYPQGGTGYLFSNYAVRKFVENIDYFRNECYRWNADDLAFISFFKFMNISVVKWATERFFNGWPLSLYYNETKVDVCPKYFILYPNAPKIKYSPIRRIASIHMMKIPMPLMKSLIFSAPEDLCLYYYNSYTLRFCKENSSLY